MKPNPSGTKTFTTSDRAQPARERDDALEPGRERATRISAAQLAAPSTRRWRRAGRFASTPG